MVGREGDGPLLRLGQHGHLKNKNILKLRERVPGAALRLTRKCIISLKPSKEGALFHSHFTHGEIEARGGTETWPKSLTP